MKIAVIGAGISGLTAANQLSRNHQVVVFEAGAYIGGHTNTVDVALGGRDYAIDTGFIVFNDRTYPNYCRLIEELNVASQPTSMTFSVRCDRSGLEYRGGDINGLFAQRRNLFRPAFYGFIKDFLRFRRRVDALEGRIDETMTVREFFDQEKFGPLFVEQYFLPMGSAIWSCPRGTFEQFPVSFIIEFYRNHGLLSVTNRPQWRVISGGSREYVRAMTSRMSATIHPNSPVQHVERDNSQVSLTINGELQTFDHVIFACHSDQALKILGNTATTPEREVLQASPYERNLAVLHTDASVLPRSRRAWASWNYQIPAASESQATVTYNMNILQGLTSEHTFCVTLNPDQNIRQESILQQFVYEHPVFTIGRAAAQRRHIELINQNRTSFCGAYWGNGFHEDGVRSALAVCEILDATSEQAIHGGGQP